MNGPRTRTRSVAAGLLLGALAAGSVALGAGEREEAEFAPLLTEMRSAVSHVSELRTFASRGGDRIKETCIYERLRGIMQAVDAAQVAQVAWEGARARNDQPTATSELDRGKQALDLVRRMRNEADNCVGKDLQLTSSGGGATTVTVESNVRDDDPNAGPVESWAIRPPRLELPGRPTPASPFRQPQ